MAKPADMENAELPPSMMGEVGEVTTARHDAVFGEITEDGPNYRDVSFS